MTGARGDASHAPGIHFYHIAMNHFPPIPSFFPLRKIFLFLLCFFFPPSTLLAVNIEEVIFHDPSSALEGFERQTLYSQKGSALDATLLRWDEQSLKEYLQQKGYCWAKVEGKIEGQKILFTIDSGPQVEVVSVNIEGGSTLPESAYREVFEEALRKSPYPFYHPWRWLGMRKNPLYVSAQIPKAISEVEKKGKMEGFWEIRATSKKVSFPSRDSAVITIEIQEGPRYLWGKMEYQGDGLWKKYFLPLSGKNFSQKELFQILLKLREEWEEGGFFQGELSYKLQLDSSLKKIHFRMKAVRNQQTRVARIFVQGNQTREKVLLRYLTFAPGEVLTRTKWQESLQLLKSTGFFEKVEFHLRPSFLQGAQDLEIQVEEASDGKLQFLGGFSSELGFFGGMGFEIHNFDLSRIPTRRSDWKSAFRGGGQSFRIQSLWGEKASQSQILFQEPFLFGSPIRLSTKFFYQNWDFSDYKEQRWGGGIFFSRSYSWIKMEVGYLLENIRISVEDKTLPADILKLEDGLRVASLLYRPSVWYHSKGIGLSTSFHLEIGHLDWASQVNFTRITLPAKGKISLWKEVFFQGEIEGGWGREFQGGPLPYPLRFFLGGHSTLRGFAFRRAGREQNGFPLGGSAFWRARGEIHFPLWKWISLVSFVDAGDLGEDLKILRHGSMRLSAGGGFRFYLLSKEIPMALDFATPVFKREEDKEQIVSFAMELSW